MDFKTLLVLACVAAGSLAGPVRETQCAEQCNSREDEGMFRSFKSYYFSYAVDIDSRINGSDIAQSSTVRIEATAVIEGLSACDKMLILSDISILERQSDGIMVPAETESTFALSLSAHPLRFSMESNGTITSVCPEAGEEIWALNVKRGFLSHMQTKRTTSNDVLSVAGVFETSVTGTCMPVYSPTGEMSFIKSNDYLMCKHRTNLNMFVDAVPVHLLAPTASPLTSRMECEYTMDSQSISTIECQETHTLKPFAESESHPEVRVRTMITKTDVRPTISSSLGSEFARRTSLLYENPSPDSEISSRDVRKTITQICESITNGISHETPGLFETLTKQFGELDMDNMYTVINRLFRICPETNEVINMVKDALTDCDTEQCAQGFHSIINSENSAENDFYLRKWFMKLVFHKNPTKNMIDIVKRYVHGSEEVNLPAYYALSSMIHQYCRISDDDCSRDPDIQQAAVVFEDNLHESCLPENEEDEKRILMSVRAIGNMGLIQTKSLLNRCNRDQNSNQLRVASIQAYRRVSCVDVPTDRFMRVFSTVDNDSELRIAAYRAIIRCPSEELLQGIASTMALEPTNQVTCYVSSHLANLRNSQDPMVSDLQSALGQSPLANVTKCGMDYRKFSHNYGLSYFDDESGNGIHFDGDVVFSSESYLPRSGRLAMNVDVFGYGLDLFELDARTEGWQEALESLMAPSDEDRDANMIRSVQRMFKKRARRQRREGIKNSALNKIRNQYESNHDLEQEEIEQASLAMKVFGNDVFYKDRDDFERMAEKFSRENIMQIIASLTTHRTHEYSLNKNFKASKVSIPTMAGMPLEVNIQGAFNSILKASGKLDVLGMVASPRTLTIKGSFEPSAAIEVSSNMMVDAHCARSGLSHKINMATSLSLGGSLSFADGLLNVKVDAPPRRETVIKASSSLSFMQGNDQLVAVSEPEISMDETFANPRYSLHITGTRPAATFPLPGALFHTWGMEITLDKLEDSLVSYDLEVGFRTKQSVRNGEVVKVDEVRLLVGAEGSESIGVYSMDLHYHRANSTLLIDANTPFHGSTYFIGSLRNEQTNKRLHLQATSDATGAVQTYVLDAGMDTIPLSNGIKFIPVFSLTIPDLVSYNLEGYISSTEEDKVVDLSLVDGSEQRLISLRGDLIKNDTMRLLSVSGNVGAFSGSLQGGYKSETTPSSLMITPIFSLTSAFPVVSLRLGGGPLVLSDNGVTMGELYLTSANSRLIKISNLHLEKSERRFGVQGMIKEIIPFGIEFEMTNDEQRQYSVDLTVNSMGSYNIQGTLFNKSADSIYRIEVVTAVNGNEFFNVTSEFKNQVNTHQYLDTIIKFRGNQIFRTKNGLQVQPMNSGNRFTPIFLLETNELGSLSLGGSVNVLVGSGILINNLRLVGTEDIVTLSGSASLDREIRTIDWTLNVGGAYVIGGVSGSASHRDNTLTFQTSMTSDGSSQPDYSLNIELQNSTKEGEIFAWDGKIELDMPHHPELSFRMDTEYALSDGRSSGNVFRLCYDGIDCTSTDKRITLSHDLTFNHVRNVSYSHDMEVSYTHPAVGVDLSMEWTTGCVVGASSGMELTLRDHEEDLFTTTMRYTAEGPSTNGSVAILLTAPGYFDYESTDIFHFSNPMDILWLSKYRSGEQVMSFLVRFNMTAESETVFGMTTVLEYTDIRNNAYTLEYIFDKNNDNKLDSMTIKKNSELKLWKFEEDTMEKSETRIFTRYIRAIRTTFQPVQDIRYYQAVTIDRQTGNANADLQLRFLPGQKPISLIADFTNRSTEAKEDGQIIATLTLPKTAITVLTEGKLEKGVPSGNMSIKIQPLMRSAETYAVELAMKNRSSSSSQAYDTALTFRSPANVGYGLKHTVEYMFSEDQPPFMTTSFTGMWGEEEIVFDGAVYVHDPLNEGIACDLSLTTPVHVYSLGTRFNMESRNITLAKDSVIIWSSNYTQNFLESDAGFSYSLRVLESVMSYGSVLTLTLSNISNSYELNLQIQENDRENLYTNWELDLFPGQKRFDLATETRSDFLPGYNTRTSLNFEETELAATLFYSHNVDNRDVFSLTFTNGASDDPVSRTTKIVIRQPTNPSINLHQVVLVDSCSMNEQGVAHNTTLMWGSLLPTQTVALRFIGRRNQGGAGATLMLRNEGRILGFGRVYTLNVDKTKTESQESCNTTFTGENGNIVSVLSVLSNNSLGITKDYGYSITTTILDRHPITVATSLIQNSGNTVVDADLTITYSIEKNQKLTAGIEVTRVLNGHSIHLNLQHLVNTVDVDIIGTYSNTSEQFEVSLENSVLLGDERHMPELSFTLNRATKEVSFMYTGSRRYGFWGHFINRTTEAGRAYQINCRNTYDRRVVPYAMMFSEPRRLVGMTVQYNPDNADDIWEFLAGYQNDTAVFASLDTVHSGQTIQNGSLVFSLDGSMPKVLTTQIKWEPAWPQDLKAAVQDIINKTIALQAEKHASICGGWKKLANRLNQTAMNFMVSNIDIYTRMQLLKTSVEAEWELTTLPRMVQIGNLVGKWMAFNQTFHNNFVGLDEKANAYIALAMEFANVDTYFSTRFNAFSEAVTMDWLSFEELFRAIQDEFNGTAIAAHLAASDEAKNAFFDDLFTQFEQDIESMDPDFTPLSERLYTIGQNLNAVGERIREEFNTRIAALRSEKRAIKNVIAAIAEDVQSFNASLRTAASNWEVAIERELELFRNIDFSQILTVVTQFNGTIRMMMDEAAAQELSAITAQTFMAPYAEPLVRRRRQAPAGSPGNLNLDQISAALAKFNAKYTIPDVPQQVDVPQPVVVLPAPAVEENEGCNFTVLINVLKKVFNGTYELTKLDLMNGEIVVKIFLKDFSNITSFTNFTHQYMDTRMLDRFNMTKLEKVIGMLQEGSLSDFKARFMEQFTANRTYYEEMMQEIQSRMLQGGVQDALETRIIPYLGRIGDRIVEGGRPFFGRIMDLPDEEMRRSFLEELTSEMDFATLERMYGKMKQTMCGVRNAVTAVAMKARFGTCPHSWMPPYGANALVIGAQHYMTFDKLFYDFSGKCGYILARDFVHENDFSAIVDYERDMEIPIRNMMFMINSTTFEIKSDGTVRVNRQPQELPLQRDGTVIIRIGNSIFLKNSEGISVVCKLPHDICVLKLSGRYFDRTAGLLGNFNFEPYDDLKTPSNELQTNITAFTESWKVGKNCLRSEAASLDRNRVLPTMDPVVNFDPLHPDNEACASMFLDNCSPLAACHGGVDPDSFYRMCILDTRTLPEAEQKSKMCSIAVAYKTQCWFSKQPVRMPDECITCEVGEQSFQADQPIRIKGEEVPRKVDIVFVVEEKRCAREDALLLDDMVARLASELENAGYEDTWFGLSGFGGIEIHDEPHEHTINHKLFNNRTRDFLLGLDSLVFEDGDNNDTFAAVKYAANYPFRAGAAKHIILLSCSEFTGDNSELSFRELSVMLRKRAISLTILTDYQFSVSNSKSKSKSELVYGIDSTATYTSKMAGLVPFKGSGSLRQRTTEPKGVNALLAQESGGAIFDSSKLRDKSFNEVFVKRLVFKTEPAECQVCSCVHDDLLAVGRSVCEKCTDPLNMFGEEIRAGVRDFELKHALPHWRYPDQIVEEDEE
ncbi:uncharacterized protein LOC129270861 [Lytechinus pictus]|uniref:uncharacterized protein LOC129270861 n=1 Tax=Lytechinus pictus TaxID=7653 RepID=UPI0030B9F1DE